MTSKPTTVISTKGRMTLPKAVRERHHWSQGTRLTVEERPDGVLLRSAPLFEPTTIDQVFGCLKYDGPAKSLEEMDAAINVTIRERHARGRY